MLVDLKSELSLYINNITFIQRELQVEEGSSSQLQSIFDHLDNFYEQIRAVRECNGEDLTIFNSKKNIASSVSCSNVYLTNLDRTNVRNKLLYKLNGLLNEKVESLQTIM